MSFNRSLIIAPIRWHPQLALPLLPRLGVWTEVDGLPVGALDLSKGPQLLDKVARSLNLIELLSSRHYHRIRLHIRRIFVLPLRNAGGSWWPVRHVCALDHASVFERSPGLIATYLVHEATHARLDRLGPGVYLGRKRLRSEACCLRNQLSFSVLLPRADYPRLDAFLEYLRHEIARVTLDARHAA